MALMPIYFLEPFVIIEVHSQEISRTMVLIELLSKVHFDNLELDILDLQSLLD